MSFQRPLEITTQTAHGPLTLDRLCFTEQLMIWAWRVAGGAGPGSPTLWCDLRDGFALAGAEDGAAAVIELLNIVAFASRRPLDIRCIHCREIGGDEWRLTDAVAACQHGRFDVAIVLIANFAMPPAAQRLVCDGLCLLANELSGAGLHLPPRVMAFRNLH